MDADYTERLRRGQVFLADCDELAGLIVLVDQPDHLLIENVAVDPPRQGTASVEPCLILPRIRHASANFPCCACTRMRR